MKGFFLVLFVCFWSHFYSQKLTKIDSLISTKDVESFIKNDNNKIKYSLRIDDKINYDGYCSVIADSLNLKQSWNKSDFDNNGLTDLLVTGNTSEGPQTVYVLDKGDHFESKSLSKGKLYEECSFSIVKNNKIEYYSVKILDRYGSLSKLTKESLIYKNGDFIEENPNPKKHNILIIEFENRGSHWNRSVTK